jgi:hypothetical protein
MATIRHPGLLEDMDDATASLIFRLQLEDSERLAATSKGKEPLGQLPDAEIALRLYTAELENTATLVRDHQFALTLDPHGTETAVALILMPPRPEYPTPQNPQAAQIPGPTNVLDLNPGWWTL